MKSSTSRTWRILGLFFAVVLPSTPSFTVLSTTWSRACRRSRSAPFDFARRHLLVPRFMWNKNRQLGLNASRLASDLAPRPCWRNTTGNQLYEIAKVGPIHLESNGAFFIQFALAGALSNCACDPCG